MNALGPNECLIDVPGSRWALATPALILDLDIFEANLAAFARFAGEAGLRMRPHAKTHKCTEIARRQVSSGALGVCCATLREADAMAEAGIAGILVTSPVVGAARTERLVRLAARSQGLMVVADNHRNVAELSDAAGRAGIELPVLVDIDVGMNRTGTADAEAAVSLAKRIGDSANLRYAGIQAYSGKVQHIESFAARRAEYGRQMDYLSELVGRLTRDQLKPGIVTGGGTGTMAIDRERGLFTEHQAGSFIFMDVEYNAVEILKNGPLPFATSLFVQCGVVSNNHQGFVTIDGGFKCFATDGPKPVVAAEQKTAGIAGASYDRFGDEHGKLVLAPGSNQGPGLGDPVVLVTPHCDPTVNLHNYYHCVRGDRLEAIWPIEGRGVL